MKKEMDRLNSLLDWFKLKLDKIKEVPVDDRPRMLERLYRISEKNKHLGVTITRAGTLNPVNYPGYPPKLKFMAHSRGLSLASVRPSLHHAVKAVIAINYMALDHFSISYY